MKKLFDKLNLRPLERRLVVIGAVVVFLVVQFLYVWPHFGDVGRLDKRRADAVATLATYEEEFGQTNKIAAAVGKLESATAPVPPEDQASDFMQAIVRQSGASGVSLTSQSKPTARTNDAFFLDLRSTVTSISTEEALVNFLYSLGEGNSLIRVRDLIMRPDPTRLKLTTSITLVASYQKAKPATRAAAPGVKPPAPATTPPKPAAAAPAASKPAPAKPALPKPSNTTKK